MDKVIPKRTFYTKRKLMWLLTGVVGITMILMFRNVLSSNYIKMDAKTLHIATVTSGVYEDFIPIKGQIEPVEVVFLDATVSGVVENIFVEDGDDVIKGQKLVILSNTQLNLDVIASEAQISEQLNNLHNSRLMLEQNSLNITLQILSAEHAIVANRRELHNAKKLLENKSISESEYQELVESSQYLKKLRVSLFDFQTTDKKIRKDLLKELSENVSHLQKNLKIARNNLNGLTIKSSINGRITSFDLKVGESKIFGERLGQVDDISSSKVSAFVDEYYLDRVSTGQKSTSSIGGKSYELALVKVYPQVTNGRFKIDYKFKNETPPNIRRGQNIQLKHSIGESSEALLVERGSFMSDTAGKWVFLVNDNKEAIKTRVTFGRSNSRNIEVLSGLSVGSKIVVSSYSGFEGVEKIVFVE